VPVFQKQEMLTRNENVHNLNVHSFMRTLTDPFNTYYPQSYHWPKSLTKSRTTVRVSLFISPSRMAVMSHSQLNWIHRI